MIKTATKVFLSPALANEDIHFSAFMGGDIYVAGAFEDPDPPPSLPELVQLEPANLEALTKMTARHINLESGQSIELLASGRAYLPRTTTSLPIITKLPWTDLFKSDLRSSND